VVIDRLVSRVPTTSHGRLSPAPIRARCSTAAVMAVCPCSGSAPTPIQAWSPAYRWLSVLSISA
jgi:hypothetical protein